MSRMSLIRTHIKNMLPTVMVIGQYLLTINLINLDLGEDAAYNLINSMPDKSKYCSGVMKKAKNF